MRYELRLNAYDMLDHVTVSSSLSYTPDAAEEPPRVVLHYLTTVPGTGETDPRVWMRDALLATLEDI